MMLWKMLISVNESREVDTVANMTNNLGPSLAMLFYKGL